MTELVVRLAEDLETAFPDFVEAHQNAVFGAALRCTGNWQDAEEVAQETFVRAFTALRAWEGERIRDLRVRGWLLSIALNVVRNRVRDASRRPQPSGLDGEAAMARSDLGLPEPAMDRSEARSALAEALTTLPAAHREAVVLRHVAGLGYQEIAEALDCPVGTAKARVHRGVRTLGALLEGDTRVMEVL